MFSQFFTAAKGLFATQDSAPEVSSADSLAASTNGPKNQSPQTPSMVTATRRGLISSPASGASPELNGSGSANGKRKGRSGNTDGQSNKRRKRESLDVSEQPESPEIPEAQDVNGGVQTGAVDGVESSSEEKSQTSQNKDQVAEEAASAPKRSNHLRFGSEEPAEPVNVVEEEVAEARQEEEEDESDDDEAPEAIDNSAQLKALKAQAQKQEEAKRRFVLV